MNGGLDLASIGRVTPFGGGIVGGMDFDYLARVVPDHIGAFDEIGVSQSDLIAGEQTMIFRRGRLAEIILLDVNDL